MRSPHESYRNVHRQGVRPDRAAAGPGGGDGEVVGRSATLFTAAFDQTTDVGTYVAMESFEGSLRGRPGSFDFAHSAMTSGSDRTAEFFTIVPTSGTGEGLVREEDAAVLGAPHGVHGEGAPGPEQSLPATTELKGGVSLLFARACR
ncbi:hypothetical protein SRO_7092 [Streptomyces rochei]|nr:hypothetical protein SRO_7092 [Streptomyces rochei]